MRKSCKNYEAHAVCERLCDEFEYFLYKDIEQTLTLMGLTKFEFIIPESEFAYLDIYGRKILMCHGHQVKSAGGVGGLFPPMLRGSEN